MILISNLSLVRSLHYSLAQYSPGWRLNLKCANIWWSFLSGLFGTDQSSPLRARHFINETNQAPGHYSSSQYFFIALQARISSLDHLDHLLIGSPWSSPHWIIMIISVDQLYRYKLHAFFAFHKSLRNTAIATVVFHGKDSLTKTGVNSEFSFS